MVVGYLCKGLGQRSGVTGEKNFRSFFVGLCIADIVPRPAGPIPVFPDHPPSAPISVFELGGVQEPSDTGLGHRATSGLKSSVHGPVTS